MTLREKIAQQIQSSGPIPFSRYMEMCLYDPELGYYLRNAEQFGKAGDFYTSSDVHAVFGRLLARQFAQMWEALGSPLQLELVELGPGRGLFAQDVLDWSEKKFPGLFAALRYRLVERSAALRNRIHRTLERHLLTGKASLEESMTPPTGPALVFANEFFDAFPVEVIGAAGSLRIGLQNRQLVETWAPASHDELEFLRRYSVHPENGERLEAPLAATRYMRELAASLTRGFVVVVDYGYTRDEQLAGRHRGTLAAFRRHSLTANPYQAPGEQDLTADVNFTALAAEAESAGMTVQKLITQCQFLMGIGEQTQFADAFEECRLQQERAKVALQLKHLVTPAGMGESFHVLVASKGVEPEQVARLSGLGFGQAR